MNSISVELRKFVDCTRQKCNSDDNIAFWSGPRYPQTICVDNFKMSKNRAEPERKSRRNDTGKFDKFSVRKFASVAGPHCFGLTPGYRPTVRRRVRTPTSTAHSNLRGVRRVFSPGVRTLRTVLL